MNVWIIHTDGTETVIERAYRIRMEDGVLKIRTSYDGSWSESWRNFPLANIREWRTGS